MSRKFYKGDLEEFFLVVRPGDILEFPRGSYSHYAVYVGRYQGIDHCLIHMTVPEEENLEGFILVRISQSIRSKTSVQKALESSEFALKKATGERAGQVTIDSVENVIDYGGSIMINNSKDKKWSALKSDDIVQRAKTAFEKANELAPYNLVTNNCEHFANGMRYDKHKSCQVENTVAATLVGGLLAVGAAAAVNYLISDREKPRRR